MKLINCLVAILFGLLGYIGTAYPQSINTFKDCAECPEMVVIQHGSYLMGSNSDREEEKPVHLVTIESNFAVGKYEITRNQYEYFVNTSNYSYAVGCETWDLPSFNMNLSKSWVDPDFEQNSNHPVVCISWHDAQAYVSWLSAVTGEQYRLLSESEWEYVARAGSSTRYNFGDNIDSTKANYGDEFRGTTAVGTYAANEFGLYDIHGNASEWVNDCWVDSYEHAPITGASMTDGYCKKSVFKKRVFRGGTWNNSAEYLRSAYRYGYFPEFKLSGVGFRVAKAL